MDDMYTLFTDSLVDVCRIRGIRDSYPPVTSIVPLYPSFTSILPLTQVNGKPEKKNLIPFSHQDLGDTVRMLVLGSIYRSIPSTRPNRKSNTRYVVVSDRGSDWIQLIQFIDNTSLGFVCANRAGGIDFDYDKLMIKSNFLVPFYGKDSSGNLDDNVDGFISTVLTTTSNHVSRVLSDCSRTNPFTIVKVASRVLKREGSLILRVNSVDESLIYIISHLFEKVTLVRPLLQDVYVVATGFKPNQDALMLLNAPDHSFKPLDKDFIEWLETAVKGVNQHIDVTIDHLTARRILNI